MRRGEIWLINLDPVVGAEMRKTRPALIISNDALGKLPLKVVVPVTGWKDSYQICPWMVRIEPDTHNGLAKVSSEDCFQIRSVSVDRFVSLIGSVAPEIIIQVKHAVSVVISD